MWCHAPDRRLRSPRDSASPPTAAAECGVLGQNLWAVMSGGQCSASYDGYTSCPLVTGYSKCILAEFKFDGVPLETLPIDQGKERWMPFVMKKELMPILYWKFMLK